MSDLFELLRKLGMRLSHEALDALLTHAQKSRLSPTQLCEIEQRERDTRNLARRAPRPRPSAPAWRSINLGALIDRFAQHCHTVDIDADSWRDRNSLKRSSPRKKKDE